MCAELAGGIKSGRRWRIGPGFGPCPVEGSTTMADARRRTGISRRTLLMSAAKVPAVSVAAVGASAASKDAMKWVVFYGEYADEQVLSAYDLVILDPMFKGSVAATAERGARVCAYLSLGEIRVSDPLYARADRGALLDENQAWPGTRRVDLRNRDWRDLVVRQLVPAIVTGGFGGIMLDTLDTPPYLEQINPRANAGMRQAAIDLVRDIRASQPGMLLLINRGYAILPDLADSIDGIIAESSADQSGANEGRRLQMEYAGRGRAAIVLALAGQEAGPAVTHPQSGLLESGRY